MMAKSKTSVVHSSHAENYFRKAREYRDSMHQALADGRPNAAALNGIHCAISAADSLCVRFHGKRSSSKDHGDAVRLLAELFVDEEARNQANRLGVILTKKNQVEYEERMFSHTEAANLVKQVDRLFTWVTSRMGKPA
jgi:HEPN domain-containing protein